MNTTPMNNTNDNITIPEFKIPDTFNLAETCVIMCVKIGVPTLSKSDKLTTEETASSYGATDDAVNVVLRGLPKHYREDIQKLANEARRKFNSLGAFWEAGKRLVLGSDHAHALAEMRRFKMQFEDMVRTGIGDKYEEIKKEAEASLASTLAARFSFPEKSDLLSRFYFDIEPHAVPDPKDFRLRHVNADERNNIVAAMQKQQKDQVQNILKSVFLSLVKVVEDMVRRTEAYDTGESVKWYDSIITNVRELVDVVGKHNITDDPYIAKLAGEISERLACMDPAVLKANPEARKEAIKTGKDILSKLRAGALAPKPVTQSH